MAEGSVLELWPRACEMVQQVACFQAPGPKGWQVTTGTLKLRSGLESYKASPKQERTTD